MEKTLGGDRLGSGNKMKVGMHNYERSSHNKSFIWRSTMSAGTLVPFLSTPAMPGDTWDINLDANIMTHPTVGPLFGSFKVQLDVFLSPIRLYEGKLHNNKLKIGLKMSDIKLPQITLAAPIITDYTTVTDIDNCQINPSCILAYLGIRGVGIADNVIAAPNRGFNGVPILTYWDIYKNYYSNKQEEIGVVIHTAATSGTNSITDVIVNGVGFVYPVSITSGGLVEVTYTGTYDGTKSQLTLGNGQKILFSQIGAIVYNVSGDIRYQWDFDRYGTQTITGYGDVDATETSDKAIDLQTFPLENIDTMRENIMAWTTNSAHFQVLNQSLLPYDYLKQTSGGFRSVMNSQEGLGVKTYNSDLLNNWLSTEWIDGVGGISEITAVDTSGGSFTIDALNLSNKIYNMLNRIGVSDGTYDSWLDVVYTHERTRGAETPMYMGGLIKELVFQEVVSNADSNSQPLGTLAGRGTLSHSKHKGGKIVIKVDEPSYIMGIISLTPRLDYSQGNQWDVNIETMDDWHKPALDEIGFQELITEQAAWWDTKQTGVLTWEQKSAGKQPAWINYMTDINRVRGNFAIENNEAFMVMTRRYEAVTTTDSATIKDLTTYIDPRKFNHMFAQTSLDSQNFWVQIGADVVARQKISAKIMPNL
nr:MAG: major capsid protein [Microviridae sp.]